MDVKRVLVFVLCLNIGLALWERYWAKKLNSDILIADAAHFFGDIFTTIIVIVWWQLAAQGYYWLDTLFAIVVSVIILYLSFQLFQKVVPILLDSSAYDADKVASRINTLGQVQVVRRVRSRSSGKDKIADVIITVAPDLSTAEAHLIANKIEKILADEFSMYDVVVHI